jgi:hypothetical protein
VCGQHIFSSKTAAICPQCGQTQPVGRNLYYSPLIPTLQLYWKFFPEWAEKCYYPWTGELNNGYPLGVMSDLHASPNWYQHPELLVAEGHLGFILFLDGAQVYRTANYSATPVFLMNANLSPTER